MNGRIVVRFHAHCPCGRWAEWVETRWEGYAPTGHLRDHVQVKIECECEVAA